MDTTPPRGLIGRRYRPIRFHATGGFGTVDLGEDTFTGDRVAIKWLRLEPGWRTDQAAVEVVSLRRAALPGVVGLREEGRTGDWWYIVMDWVEGTPFPGAFTPPGWEGLRPVVSRLLETLVAVHAEFVHGDLKPPNVLVRASGEPVVLDFGVAGGSRLPGGGILGGTGRYMAPEVRAGHRDARSDLYAVGVMIAEALGTRVADASATVTSLAPLSEGVAIPEGLPPFVSALIRELTADEPEDRPASAFEVLRRIGLPEYGPVPSAEGTDLTGLFTGPEVFLHLRSRAARLLAEVPADRRGATLELWWAEGVVVREGGQLRPLRHRLERLEHQPEEATFDRLDLDGAAPEVLVAEALGVAKHWRMDGRPGRAVDVLERAFDRVRGHAHLEEVLLLRWVAAALSHESTRASSAAICAIRCAVRAEALAPVEALLAMSEALRRTGRIEAASLPPPFADDELETWRVAMSVLLARQANEEEEAIEARRAWADTPAREASRQIWLGNLRYRQGRYGEAAAAFLAAAEGRPTRDGRLGATLSAAMALLEVPADTSVRLDAEGDLGRAVELARRARDEARGCCHPELEVRAERHLRAALYRLGRPLPPDEDMVDAALEVDPVYGGLLALVDAATSLRAGEGALAARIAARGSRALRRSGRREAAALCRAIELRSTHPAPGELAAAVQAADGLAAPFRMQVLSLCGGAPGGEDVWLQEAAALAGQLSEDRQHTRLDVLSPAEAVTNRWQH